MMFKFMAWDRKREELLPVKQIDYPQWWVSCDPTYGQAQPLEYGERNSFQNQQTDRHILMPFTGVVDKNGKEIYERFYVKVGPIYGGEFIAPVRFLNGSYGLVLKHTLIQDTFPFRQNLSHLIREHGNQIIEIIEGKLDIDEFPSMKPKQQIKYSEDIPTSSYMPDSK